MIKIRGTGLLICMKVFRISTKSIVSLTIVIVMLLTIGIAMIFGDKEKDNSVAPNIKIVLPEGV